MPYATAADAPDYVPAPRRAQWVAVWNSAYRRAQHDGRSDKQAEQSAFAQANGVAGPSKSEWSGYLKAVGTDRTGFVRSQLGPFKCGHCLFQQGGYCRLSDVLADPEVASELDAQGRLAVDAGDCCNEYEPATVDKAVTLVLLKAQPAGMPAAATTTGLDDSSVGTPILYLVRHGETELNRGRIFRGWSDAMLTEKGKRQAGRAGLYLKDKGIGRIIASNLARTKQTAEIVHNAVSGPELDEGRLEVELDARLNPLNVGIFTGREKTPENMAQFRQYVDNPHLVIPHGESIDQCRARIQAEIAKLKALAARMDRPLALVMSTSDIVAAIEYEDLQSAVGPSDLWQWWYVGSVDDTIPPGSVTVVGTNGVEIADLGAEPVSQRKSRLVGFLPGGGTVDRCCSVCRNLEGPDGRTGGRCHEAKVQVDDQVPGPAGDKRVQADDVCDQWQVWTAS